MPLSLALFVWIIGLFYLYKQSYGKAKFYLTLGFLWSVLIAYSPVSNALLQPLESSYAKIDITKQKASYILLLGGDFQARAYEAIRLHYLINDSKIITSGYPGLGKTKPEAEINAHKLMELGIKKEDILTQSEPKDTQEEAIMIKQMLGQSPFILVTSAYHMPRAMEIFKNEGLSPIPAPTNFLVKECSLLSMPNGSALHHTEIAQHEYFGILWYRLKTFFK